MAPMQFIFQASNVGKTYSAVGDAYTILASGEQTGGAYCLVEAVVPPGGGPPPHIHGREDEMFYILEGEITFMTEGKTIIGKAGTFVQLPRGVAHAFKNNSNRPARMLVQCVPAGFDKFMMEFATELPSRDSVPLPPSPAEIEKLIAVAPKYGITILPPPGR
jgi:quercetin dioxygenase-like cupin family protein